MTNRIGLLAGAALAALVATGASAADVTLTFTRAGDSATVAKIFDPIIKAFEEANPGIARSRASRWGSTRRTGAFR